VQVSEKRGIFEKAQPTGLSGFSWVLGFTGFLQIFLFEQAVGKLVG